MTAVYNGQEYLEESIESILKQTYKDFEYIIVNDGSADRTEEILNNIKDTRVKVIHLEKNGGAASALNIAINVANGKWIALQDADDVSNENRLQQQLQYIKSDSRLVAVGSLIQCIPGNDQVDQNRLSWEEAFFNSKNHFRKEQFISTPFCHGTGFFSKEAFRKIGGYDSTFHIAYDYDLWTRMFEVGEISRVPEVLYQYRIHGSSLAHSNTINTTKEVLLSTFKLIAALRFRRLNRKPNMLLTGTKNNIDFYRQHLHFQNHYVTMSFLDIDHGDIKEAYSLYRSKEIDGIIIASNQQINQLLGFFRRRGMSFGKNLFMIWMP